MFEFMAVHFVRHTHRICREQCCSPWHSPNMSAAFDKVYRVDVIRVDDARATHATHDLAKDVPRDLAPWKIAEGRHCDRHGGIDVAAGDPSRHPHAQRRTYNATIGISTTSSDV